MSFPLLPALARVLASIDAPRNLRALYALLAAFCFAGLLLAMARSAVARDQSALSALWMGLALAVAFFGVNATGLMLMDQARGLPVRDPQDALADALRSGHRVLLSLLACLALAAAGVAVLAALLWATRWPWVGAPLLAVVLPAGVLLLGATEQADQHPVGHAEPPDAACRPRGPESQGQPCGTDEHRHHHAEAIGQPTHQDAAHAEADHHGRVGQGGIGPRHAELGLHRGQDHRYDVHAAAADGHQRQRDDQTHPGVTGVDGVGHQGREVGQQLGA